MATPFALDSTSLVALPRQSLAALRNALLRDLGGTYAAYLQEAGSAGGNPLYAAFDGWLAARGRSAERIGYAEFQQLAAEFFKETGWGSLEIGTLNDAVITLDSADWAEADPSLNIGFSACYYSMGLFADLFGHVADAPLTCYEVECRSNGAPRCRFLLGNAAVIKKVYERVAEGGDYMAAVDGVA